jgi:hypothetical protein
MSIEDLEIEFNKLDHEIDLLKKKRRIHTNKDMDYLF